MFALTLCFALILCCQSLRGCRFNRPCQLLSIGVRTPLKAAAQVDDKARVTEYFNNEGFRRWNNIYSHSNDVNKVQLYIRSGHQQTIDKVLGWLAGEDNKNSVVCDAGCGVGSLAIPLASKFRKVFASDISSSMITEAMTRASACGTKNIDFQINDLENLDGKYDTVTCTDVMIHYPTEKMIGMISKLTSIANDRVILSFAPKTPHYQVLKKIGEFFPGKSKATRAYLHAESDVVDALKKAGFQVGRSHMTATNFYFSKLLEAVKTTK